MSDDHTTHRDPHRRPTNTQPPELITGATRKLQDAITPLAYQTPHWTGTQALISDPLYQRMRDALTAATATSGAPLQASKAPARIDILTWLCDIDTTVAHWQPEGLGTITKLDILANHKWTPDDLPTVKQYTSRCEHWTAHAKELLRDNPPVVPLRKPCPLCGAFWTYNREQTRTFALRVSEHGAQCHSCHQRWTTNQEISILIRMLG